MWLSDLIAMGLGLGLGVFIALGVIAPLLGRER